MADHVIKAVFANGRRSLVEKHDALPVSLVRSQISHVNGIVIVHVCVLGIYAGVPIFTSNCFSRIIYISFERTLSLLGEPHNNLIISFIKTIIITHYEMNYFSLQIERFLIEFKSKF